jgi:hypothetical protein
MVEYCWDMQPDAQQLIENDFTEAGQVPVLQCVASKYSQSVSRNYFKDSPSLRSNRLAANVTPAMHGSCGESMSHCPTG